MADLVQDAQVLGEKFSIVIHRFETTCVAYMTRRGRKKIWTGYGASSEDAKTDVLRYLDKRLHPFVNVTVKGA